MMRRKGQIKTAVSMSQSLLISDSYHAAQTIR